MARKIKYVGLQDRDRKFYNRKQIKKKGISADDVLKYIDKGLEYASSPLVSSVVQAVGGAMQPSEEDIIAAQLEEGKGVGLLEQINRVALEPVAEDPRQAAAAAALDDTASIQAAQNIPKGAAADLAYAKLMEDLLAQQGEALMEGGGAKLSMPTMFGPKYGGRTIIDDSPPGPEPGSGPIPVTQAPGTEPGAPPYEPDIASGRTFDPNYREVRELASALQAIPGMGDQLVRLETAMAANPIETTARIKDQLDQIPNTRPTLDRAGQQALDAYELQLKNILKRRLIYRTNPTPGPQEHQISDDRLTVEEKENALWQRIDDYDNWTAEEKAFWKRIGNLAVPAPIPEPTLEDVSPGEVPVPAPRSGEAGGFVPVPGSSMAAAGGATAIPYQRGTSVGKPGESLSPGTLSYGLPEGLRGTVSPAAAAPSATGAQPPLTASTAAEPSIGPYEAGRPMAAMAGTEVEFAANLWDPEGQPDPKAIVRLGMSNQGLELLRAAGAAESLINKFQELAQTIAAPVPTFEELFPAYDPTPKEILPKILPGSWEGLYALAPHVGTIKEQQRLIAHANKHLGGRAANVWEAIASLGGDTPEKSKRLKLLVSQFPKKSKPTTEKGQLQLATAKLRYRQLVDSARTKKAQAEVKLLKEFEGIKAQQARTSGAAAKTASNKNIKRMLKRSLTPGAKTGMKSNDPKALLRNLVKQNNAAARTSDKEFRKIDSELKKLDADGAKLISIDRDLYDEDVATRADLTALEGQAPPTKTRNRPNPAYATWKQNVSALKKEISKIVGKRTTVRGELERVRSKKESLANIHGSTNHATNQYEGWANKAAEIQGIGNRTEKMKQTKALLKEISGN